MYLKPIRPHTKEKCSYRPMQDYLLILQDLLFKIFPTDTASLRELVQIVPYPRKKIAFSHRIHITTKEDPLSN